MMLDQCVGMRPTPATVNHLPTLWRKGVGRSVSIGKKDMNYDARPVCRYEAHACNCKPPANPAEKGCGEECLNR